MVENKELLRPFLNDAVWWELDGDSNQHSKSTSTSTKTTKVNAQPDLVTTRMRDYQLIGLDWMVQMHNRGLGMILGDEMGLVRTKAYEYEYSLVLLFSNHA